MKKRFITISILLLIVLAVSFTVYAGNQDVKKTKQEVVKILKQAEKKDCKCSTACKEKHAEGECKDLAKEKIKHAECNKCDVKAACKDLNKNENKEKK